MRLLICLVCFACFALAGCGTTPTTQYRPVDGPIAGAQKPTPICSSSGSDNKQAVACAATIAITAVIHSVQE